MYLSGSINEIKGVISVAKKLKAKAIHFIAPNLVFILGQKNDEYVYMQSSLEIRYSVIMSERNYLNLSIYLNQSQQQKKNLASPFYEVELMTVVVTSDGLMFNDDPKLTLSVPVIHKLLTDEVGLKISSSIRSSFSPEHAYLRMEQEAFKKVKRTLAKYKKKFSRRYRTNPLNVLTVQNKQLTILTHDAKQNEEVELDTEIYEFMTNENFTQEYTVTDIAIYLIEMATKNLFVEDIIFLQNNDYCIIEAHNEHMLIKVRTRFEK